MPETRSPFVAWNSWYEAMSLLLGAGIVWCSLMLLSVILCVTIARARFSPAYGRLILSSMPLACILGTLLSPPDAWWVLWLVAVTHVTVLGYLIRYNITPFRPLAHELPINLFAVLVILSSCVLKLAHLESWPQLLNDYAAMTGFDTIQFSSKGFYHLFLQPLSPYLQGGGTSPLHAPLVHLLYQLFGPTTGAIRGAEVLGSSVVLFFLWLILRRILSPLPAIISLTLFAFSSEHLSQSRMGTFFSISQALALAVLWLWLILERSRFSDRRAIIALCLMLGLLAVAYAPVQALYIFSGIMLVRAMWCRLSNPASRALSALTLLSIGLAYYFFWSSLPITGFRVVTAIVPETDSPIWFKLPQGGVFDSIQPIGSVVHNLWINTSLVLGDTLTPPPGVEPIYSSALTLLVLGAIVALRNNRTRTYAFYTLVGLIPMLLVFPLARRGIILRPFLPIVGVLLVREYLLACMSVYSGRGIHWMLRSWCTLIILAVTMHGTYLFTRYNGVVGEAPSFGPLYAHAMIERLKRMAPDCNVVVLNPSFGVYKYKMALIDYARPDSVTPTKAYFWDIREDFLVTEEVVSALPRPTCFAVLHEDYRAWVVPFLARHLPHAPIEEVRDPESNTILFWIVTHR